MTTRGEQAISGGRRRWGLLLWWVVVALWTAALITPYPIRASHEMLPPDVGFSIGKTLHIGVYAVLACALPWLVRGGARWWLLGFLSFHAAVTELIQQFVPDRTGSLSDVGINHIGILLGVGVGWSIAGGSWSKTKAPTLVTPPATRQPAAPIAAQQ
jgi:VanZ family protein